MEKLTSKIIWRLAEQNPYNWGYKKEVTPRLVGGMGTHSRLTTNSQVVVEPQEGHSVIEVPLEEGGVWAPHWTSQTSGPVPGKEPPHLAMKSSKDSVRLSEVESRWKPKCPLKDMHRLIHLQTLTWAPVKRQQLQRCQRHTGKDWVEWFLGEG